MANEAVVNLRPMQMTLVEMGSLCNAAKPFIKDTSLNKQTLDQIENLHRRVSDGIRELNQAWTQTHLVQLFCSSLFSKTALLTCTRILSEFAENFRTDETSV